jgi:4-oxalomesaconate tautomerase
VPGHFPLVDLFLQHPVGSKTGQLLPTRKVQDSVLGYSVSCVDVAVPMVIAIASQFGKTAHEAIAALEADAAFMHAIGEVWSTAGLLMGLRGRDGQLMTLAELARSETVPKFCIVGPASAEGKGNIAVRYFTPQAGHATLAVSGGCCLAAACLIPGTVAHDLARGLRPVGPEYAQIEIGLENPAGILDTTIVARQEEARGNIAVSGAAYRRSAQILLRGHVPLYQPSAELRAWLLKQL